MAARVKIKINLNIDTNLVYYNTNAKVERVEIKDARLPVQLQVWYTSKSKQVYLKVNKYIIHFSSNLFSAASNGSGGRGSQGGAS